jgi:hypothetical protein
MVPLGGQTPDKFSGKWRAVHAFNGVETALSR